MVFEDWELKKICDCLDDEDLSHISIKMKIDEIRSKSINKRFTLRTTDWCVENGKKSSRNRRKKEDGLV